ncbi:MAG: hypothetical protein K0S47_3433 [Herbinix sp.]|jgi:hypothetical protein|nr:hypothetical protein [Herbinix sp.]
METNRKILTIGLSISGISMLVAIILIYFTQMKQPIFFEHYYDLWILKEDTYPEDNFFVLKYITNSDDGRKVTGITFPEYPQGSFTTYDTIVPNNFFLFNQTQNTVENCGRYSIHTLYIRYDGIELDMEDEILLTKAKLQFDNGETFEDNIGKIILYQEDKSPGYLPVKGGEGSSNGDMTYQYFVNVDMVMSGIEDIHLREMREYLDFRIEGVDYTMISGLDYQKGDYIDTMSKFITYKKPSAKFILYNMKPKLYFINQWGNDCSVRMEPLNNLTQFDYDTISIFRYFMEREER